MASRICDHVYLYGQEILHSNRLLNTFYAENFPGNLNVFCTSSGVPQYAALHIAFMRLATSHHKMAFPTHFRLRRYSFTNSQSQHIYSMQLIHTISLHLPWPKTDQTPFLSLQYCHFNADVKSLSATANCRDFNS